MDTAVGLHGLNESLERGLKLLILAVREQVIQEGMRMVDRELLDFFRRRGIARLGLLRLWKIQRLEQDSLKLFRRIQVEFVIASKLARGFFLSLNVISEYFLLRFQGVYVDSDSDSFHLGQDRHEWNLEFGVELVGIDFLQKLRQLNRQFHDGSCGVDAAGVIE